MSTNDFTDALLKKLNGMESGAQKNKEGTVIDNNYVHTDNNFTDAEKNKILELEQENTELSNNMPWNTTPISKSLHITDSAKYSKNRLSISGDMEQETTTANKNKIIINEDINVTQDGLTFTINKSTGLVTVNGTSNASRKIDLIDILEKLKSGESYVLSVTNIANNIQANASAVIYEKGTYTQQLLVKCTESGTTIAVKELTTDYINPCLGIWYASEVAFNNLQFKVQLEKGNSGTTWVLGIPDKPSRNYPSMPKVATGGQKIKVAKNITMFPWLESDWENGTIDGVTGELVDSTTRIRMKEYKEVEANGKYLFDTVDNIKVVAIRFYDSDYNYIRMYGSGESSFLDSITVPSNAMYYKAVVKRKDDKAITTSYVKDNKLKMYKEEETTLDLGSTELCAIKENGNVVAQDRTIYHNAKWQFDKIIKKLILNGTENWQQTTAYEGFYRYSLEINDNDLIHTGSVSIHGINSHFQQRINQNHGGYEYLYIQGISRGRNYIYTSKRYRYCGKIKNIFSRTI